MDISRKIKLQGKGTVSIYAIIIAIGILLLGGTALVAGGKVATNEVDINFNEFTEKTAINVYNELLLISATEQGVKYYDTKKRFIIKLNATHLELKYKGKTGTIADNEPKTYLYAIEHNLDNIKETTIDAPSVDRICISKRINACVPEITICLEGQECCNILPNTCKMVK